MFVTNLYLSSSCELQSQIKNKKIIWIHYHSNPLQATAFLYCYCFIFYGTGLVRQPKWGHLRDVHKAIKMCEEALVSTDPAVTSLGPNLEVSYSDNQLFLQKWTNFK